MILSNISRNHTRNCEVWLSFLQQAESLPSFFLSMSNTVLPTLNHFNPTSLWNNFSLMIKLLNELHSFKLVRGEKGEKLLPATFILCNQVITSQTNLVLTY